MNRILVIRGGAIGDFVLTLPALKLLRDNFPHAHIEILGYKHIVGLAENRYYANATRSIEYGPLASFFTRNGELPQDLVDYFGSFDQIVSYLFDPDQIFASNLLRAGVRNFVSSTGKIGDRGHATEQLAQPLQRLALWLTEYAAELYPSAEDRVFSGEFTRNASAPLIALHPGSGSPSKNWPVDRWCELASWLLQRTPRSTLLLVSGEADTRAATELSRALPPNSILVANNLPLPRLAAILQSCALFVGHDSGVSHIAAAVGIPATLLFGPSDSEIWAPKNPKVSILRAPHGKLEALAVETVQAALAARL
jgi:heptosyltransferase-2